MQAITDTPLVKVARGTVLALFGSVAGLALVFLGRIALARYLSVADYGMFSLGFVILNILAVVSLVGLERGIPQRIAYHLSRAEVGRVGAIIRSSIIITLATSVASGAMLFALSDFIAEEAFDTPGLGNVLRTFALAVPFFTLLLLVVASYRGFDRVDVKVYFSDILRNVLFILTIGVAIFLKLSFWHILYGFVISIAVPCVAIILLSIRKPLVPREVHPSIRTREITRELLFFSIPLLVAALFTMLVSWTDTIALGYFKGIDEVGIYNAALTVAQFVPILLNGMSYIYLPIVSKLYSQKRMSEIRRMYIITTKWVFSLTYPLFLIVALFPRAVIKILFGDGYLAGSLCLQILALGFFVHTLLGLNASTLLAAGETRFLMWSSAFTALANIFLNILLVSSFGLIGAAGATMLSLVILNILLSSKCYLRYRIHPFTRRYLTPILVSIPVVLGFYLGVNLLGEVESVFLLPIFFLVFLLIYFLSILLTKGFDQEDIDVIASIEKRLGLDFKKIKRILKKFR